MVLQSRVSIKVIKKRWEKQLQRLDLLWTEAAEVAQDREAWRCFVETKGPATQIGQGEECETYKAIYIYKNFELTVCVPVYDIDAPMLQARNQLHRGAGIVRGAGALW